MNRSARALIALSLLTVVAAAQSQRPLAPEDVYRLKTVSEPEVSPDGALVAYVVTTIDTAKNKRVGTIWTVATDGSSAPKALLGEVPGHAPRWSPDGKWIAFVSNAAPKDAAPEAEQPKTTPPETPAPSTPKNQVWLVARDGSSRRALTHFPNGVTRFTWSPDGTRLAVAARAASKSRDVKDYVSMQYKADGAGWSDNTHTHIWTVDVKDGATHQLTNAADRDDNDPQWSPDGKWIAFVANANTPDLREVGDTQSILAMPSAGGEAQVIVEKHSYTSAPRWSPDSKQIAYGAAPSPDAQPLLWIAPLDDPRKAALASDTDLFATEIEWDATGLWFGVHERGAAPILRVDLATHRSKRVLGGDRAIHELSISEESRRLVYLENDDTHLPEVFTSDLDGGHERQLTFHNRELLSGLQLVTSERIEFKNPTDGLPIEGFLMKPANFQPAHKYPMILTVHGGPNGMWGFHWEVEEQLFAGAGYAVLMINPRGSSGYGTKFQRAVAMEWGGRAYEDIISGVETVLQRNPWIDRDRLGIVGHSYGGFMTDWTVTQTNIFKAAIPISGISDFISVEGTRDGAYGHSRDFGGDVYSNFDLYWKYSAVRLASKVKTPVLFLHGEADQRVPSSQAEEYFRAIKHFGGTAELVLFPRESHNLPLTSEPKHLVETYQWRLYWFDRWVKGDATARRPGGTSSDAQRAGE